MERKIFVLNPHGSDETFTERYELVFPCTFLTHMVQMKHGIEAWDSLTAEQVLNPHGSDETHQT